MENRIIISFETAISYYISIEYHEKDIKGQLYPDEIVISMNEIRIEYSYPLNNKIIFFFNADNGETFTRSELARKICKGYQRIFQEDKDPKMLEGPYVMFGYNIEDLMLYTVKQINDNLFELDVTNK